MRSFLRRALGQILVDGKFLSRRTLDRALEQQKQTHELLGAVLVRMGVLSPGDVSAPLMVQQHLSSMDEAVKLAAGQRQLLGALLVQSGKISACQLDEAIAEQHRSGERLGQVFVRLGMLTELQLKGLLDLQHNQESPISNPLRLGELLVATGQITRQQLDQALARQKQTGQRLGDVIVSQGFARKSQINHVVRLQKLCVNSVLAAILSMGALTATASASTVSLQWDASTDTTVVGYKIHYQADSQTMPFQGPAPIDVQNVTSATINNLDPSHSYSFAVTAYDASGVESVYSNIFTVAEQQPPTTAITSPAASSTVAGTVSVTADAADNIGVAKVEFYVNGTLKATLTSAPYVYSWDTSTLASGSYTLQTKAYDAAGNIGQSQAVTVNLANDAIVPTVSLTSPANNVTVSGPVTVSANATDNVGVSRVAFYVNDVLQTVTNVAPFSYSWDTRTVANGVYTVSAKAYDAAGNMGQSSVAMVNVFNDLIAPAVTLTSPGTGSVVRGTVTVSANATDNYGVSKVEFYRNGTLVSTSSAAPYSYSWNTSQVANGSYTLTAKGYDASGNVGVSQSVTVTVSNDLAAPAVSLTSPGSGSTLTGTTTVSASASDNVGVARVEFYRDGALVATSSAAPFSYAWDTRTSTNGSHTLTAKAYDAAGNVGISQSVTVNVSNDLLAPTVALTSPYNNATVNGSVTVAANAADNVGVTSVRFYRSGVLIYTATSAPYKFNWNTRSVANGSYVLTARASDAAGNVTQSASVTVIVRNK